MVQSIESGILKFISGKNMEWLFSDGSSTKNFGDSSTFILQSLIMKGGTRLIDISLMYMLYFNAIPMRTIPYPSS